MQNNQSYISLDQAKDIIVKAMDALDPALGVRARSILYDDADKRLNLVERAEPQTNMMLCRPAGITIEDLKIRDMYIHDFAERYGEPFLRQDNPEEYAIVDFEYHGTVDSMIWLSHEIGHAIADDIQRENGHSFQDFETGEMEEQAYFVQHAVLSYLEKHPEVLSSEEAVEQGARVLRSAWVNANQAGASDARIEQENNAGITFDHVAQSTPEDRGSLIQAAMDQRSTP